MRDWVGLVSTTQEPAFCAAAPQQGTEVLGINEYPALNRQIHHLLRGIGGIELLLNFGVAFYLMAEVIQRIQQGLRVGFHAA